MDHAELALRFVLKRIAHPFAVSLPKPAFLRLGIHLLRHPLARRDAYAGEQRVSLHHLANARSEILLRDVVAEVVRDAVLAIGSEGEDVPGKDIDPAA
jgi:hypothetical protein